MTAAAADFKVCVVVPFYNHERAIAQTVARIKAQGLPCLIVDDGSDARCQPVLAQLAAAESAWLTVHRIARNSGKGVAVLTGFAWAAQRGYSHGLQIDADGQHCFDDIPKMVEAARAAPERIIAGIPRYDGSIPWNRYYGRWLTHLLVWAETLSTEIQDSMIGFRVYPLAAVLACAKAHRIGARMDFDTDLIVRMFWRGTRIVNMPTPVTYPSDGVSHFNYYRDNARMTWLHIRLLAGMLPRAPWLLWRSLRRL